ncbi:MAG TPA: MASE3 domain-containing protein, partial [Candidatus Omnitrophota bacterium]|nr:MASE3 domain-containing protein [Candidatus Omnitrophota bacterium]
MKGYAGITLAPGAILAFVVLVVGLYAVSAQNFLIFHTVAELFAIVVAFTAFGVAWYSRTWIGANFLLMLGIGHLFVAMIDVAHTVVYKGSGLVPYSSAGLSTQFWIAGRVIEAAAYLIAVSRPTARFAVPPV